MVYSRKFFVYMLRPLYVHAFARVLELRVGGWGSLSSLVSDVANHVSTHCTVLHYYTVLGRLLDRLVSIRFYD